jgi:putative tryptophan/tyrosine transport system substrate-binding protein
MIFPADPVEMGLVASLGRPGGNITGTTYTAGPEIFGKQLQILKEAIPRASRARGPEEFDTAFAAMARERAEALLVSGSSTFLPHRTRIAELAVKGRLPTMCNFREFVEAGALMAYAINMPDFVGHAAVYVDKILKGAKPADLPVEQPTKFELVINLKTAKALGLKIPQSVLTRADAVIQ